MFAFGDYSESPSVPELKTARFGHARNGGVRRWNGSPPTAGTPSLRKPAAPWAVLDKNGNAESKNWKCSNHLGRTLHLCIKPIDHTIPRHSMYAI